MKRFSWNIDNARRRKSGRKERERESKQLVVFSGYLNYSLLGVDF